MTRDAILAAIGSVLGIPAEAVLSHSRAKRVEEARLCGYWLARHRYGWSYPRIAREFKRACHQTVYSGARSIDGRMLRDAHLVANLSAMSLMIGAGVQKHKDREEDAGRVELADLAKNLRALAGLVETALATYEVRPAALRVAAA